MTKPLPKFSGPDLTAQVEFSHPDIWAREEFPGWSRLVIGARDEEIPLILELCREFEGPFGVLYVLTVSHTDRNPARYQSAQPNSFAELEGFLMRFQEFFEQDGRHHLWVMSVAGEGQFIFDNHNVVYAYGDLDRYERALKQLGFVPGEIRNPSPHSHNYHGEFAPEEDAVMNYWEWIEFPLQPDDDPT